MRLGGDGKQPNRSSSDVRWLDPSREAKHIPTKRRYCWWFRNLKANHLESIKLCENNGTSSTSTGAGILPSTVCLRRWNLSLRWVRCDRSLEGIFLELLHSPSSQRLGSMGYNFITYTYKRFVYWGSLTNYYSNFLGHPSKEKRWFFVFRATLTNGRSGVVTSRSGPLVAWPRFANCSELLRMIRKKSLDPCRVSLDPYNSRIVKPL